MSEVEKGCWEVWYWYWYWYWYRSKLQTRKPLVDLRDGYRNKVAKWGVKPKAKPPHEPNR